MSKNSGKYVEYEFEGKIQKGLVVNSDQREEQLSKGKVFVTLLNDDFTNKLDINEKKIVIIKSAINLKVIGFSD